MPPQHLELYAAVVAGSHDATDRRQVDTQLAQDEDLLEPHELVTAVEPATTGSGPDGRQEPDAVVVPQRA